MAKEESTLKFIESELISFEKIYFLFNSNLDGG